MLRTAGFIQNNDTNTPTAGLDENTIREMLRPVKLPSAGFLNANAEILGSWKILCNAIGYSEQHLK